MDKDLLPAFSLTTWLMLAGISVLVLGSLFVYFPSYLYPAEDATILYRYSQNLAQEGTISYNPAGETAEGATDFLWMILLSLGIKLGIDPYSLARGLSVMGIIGTYWVLARWVLPATSPKLLPVLLLLSLIFNSQLMAAVQGFSVAFYGLFIVICLYLFWHARFKALVIFSVLLGLIRPDGLIVGIPLVLGLFWQVRHEWRTHLYSLLLWGLLPGLIYFFWRAWYFGEWLPLPMYVKGGNGGFLKESVVYEIKYLLKYLFPLLGGIGLALVAKNEERQKLFILVVAVLIIPLLFYAQIRLEQNIADRFLYPIHIGSLALFFLLWPKEGLLRKGFVLLWVTYFVLSLLYFFVFLKGTLQIAYNNPYHVAQSLSEDTSYKMAVTEAGRLSYYSRWETMDLWGLNTPELAKRQVQAKDLQAFDPDLVVLALDYEYQLLDSLLPTSPEINKTWIGMVQNSYQFAMKHDQYERWMVPFWRERELPSGFVWFQGNIQQLIDFKAKILGGVYQEPYPRYHLYLVKKEAGFQNQMEPILRNASALSWEEFQKVLPN